LGHKHCTHRDVIHTHFPTTHLVTEKATAVAETVTMMAVQHRPIEIEAAAGCVIN
jgi:hypothetical protein